VRPTAAALSLLVLLPGARALACSVCGCGDPLVDASDSVPYAAPLRLALDFEVLSASAASDDDPAATEALTQVTLRPVVVYSPTEAVNLVLQLPLVHKAWSLDSPTAHSAADTTGLGDIDVGVRWFPVRVMDMAAMTRQAFGVIAGVTLPTGANDATLDGERLDDHAQLGTGAVGGYAGLTYAFHHDPWNLYTSATVHGHAQNGADYHYGTAIAWTARLDYRLIEGLAIEGGIDGRWAAQDRAGGDAQANTGGVVVALTPGFAANVFGDAWLRGRVQLPVVQALDGTQSVGPTFFVSAELLVR
jgi:hypothetical protein